MKCFSVAILFYFIRHVFCCQLNFFLCIQKLRNLKSAIIQTLQSHSQQYRDVQNLPQFKMAATDQLCFFLWVQKL